MNRTLITYAALVAASPLPATDSKPKQKDQNMESAS